MTIFYGIDYGRGTTNINPKTGIRFGVIRTHRIVPAWQEESELVYSKPHCPLCGHQLAKMPEEEFGPFDNDEAQELLGFRYKEEGYFAAQSADTSDIFIEKSPYFTYGIFCSPCAPGAIDLDSPILDDRPENNKAYCFGHDWFEGGVAPYPVFSVKTGEQILPPEEKK